MTKNQRLIIGILCCCMGISRAVRAENLSQVRASIQATYAKMDKAVLQKDAAAYVAYTAADFVNINAAGVENMHGKEGRRKNAASGFAHIDRVVEHTAIKKIVMDKGGDGVTVITRCRGSMAVTLNGRKFVIKDDSGYRDSWIRVNNVWLAKRSVTIYGHQTVNGRAIPKNMN